jgi:hypothetical protein
MLYYSGSRATINHTRIQIRTAIVIGWLPLFASGFGAVFFQTPIQKWKVLSGIGLNTDSKMEGPKWNWMMSFRSQTFRQLFDPFSAFRVDLGGSCQIQKKEGRMYYLRFVQICLLRSSRNTIECSRRCHTTKKLCSPPFDRKPIRFKHKRHK